MRIIAFMYKKLFCLALVNAQETSAMIARVQAGSGTVPPINVALNKFLCWVTSNVVDQRLLFCPVLHFFQFPLRVFKQTAHERPENYVVVASALLCQSLRDFSGCRTFLARSGKSMVN